MAAPLIPGEGDIRRVGSREGKKTGSPVSHCVLGRLSGLGVQWPSFRSLIRALDPLPRITCKRKFPYDFRDFMDPTDAHPGTSMGYSLGIIIVTVTPVTPFEAYYAAGTILSTLHGSLSPDRRPGR